MQQISSVKFYQKNIKCQVHLNQLGAKQGKWAVNSRKRSVLMRKEQEGRGG